MNKQFKKVGDSLAFNGNSPSFDIVQEVESGFFYFPKGVPQGGVNFIRKEAVDVSEDTETTEDTATEIQGDKGQETVTPQKTVKKGA